MIRLKEEVEVELAAGDRDLMVFTWPSFVEMRPEIRSLLVDMSRAKTDLKRQKLACDLFLRRCQSVDNPRFKGPDGQLVKGWKKGVHEVLRWNAAQPFLRNLPCTVSLESVLVVEVDTYCGMVQFNFPSPNDGDFKDAVADLKKDYQHALQSRRPQSQIQTLVNFFMKYCQSLDGADVPTSQWKPLIPDNWVYAAVHQLARSENG